MKREANLIEQIADTQNLYWAFWKAKRGKNSNSQVIKFREDLYVQILLLRDEILNGKIEVGNYHFFKIFDPKERQICAAPFRERVLHHAIMNICHQNFEKFQTPDSFATRQGKGTYAAVYRALSMQGKFDYFVKIDCKKYFDSIDHGILKMQLVRRFKDERFLELLFKIIDSYETTVGKGLPIGNLTSQYFANHYLAHGDHFLKEKNKLPAMVRYMDDLLLWHNNPKHLAAISTTIEDWCYSQLALTFKHRYMNTTKHGVSFLGFYLCKHHIELSRKSKQRLIYKYNSIQKDYKQGILSEKQYSTKLESILVRPCKARTFHFRNKLFRNINEGTNATGRQLLEQCQELSGAQSQQQPSQQPSQQPQHRFSAPVCSQLKLIFKDEPFVFPICGSGSVN
ncbi:MAG: RNA-directed DNA polymerase [Chitinophagaceae bacterium]|nr:RNA-directed DNA polymerase [Chitinophagaceae bacterium]